LGLKYLIQYDNERYNLSAINTQNHVMSRNFRFPVWVFHSPIATGMKYERLSHISEKIAATKSQWLMHFLHIHFIQYSGLASRVISLGLSSWQLGVFQTQNVNYTNWSLCFNTLGTTNVVYHKFSQTFD